MRVFKVSDGTSWIARLHDGAEPTNGEGTDRVGWEAVVFDASPVVLAQRLVYRPAGWLGSATTAELAAALEEAEAIRVRWGGE